MLRAVAVALYPRRTARDRALATVRGFVAAKLDSSGLFYAYNIPRGGPEAGRLAFVPLSVLTHEPGG